MDIHTSLMESHRGTMDWGEKIRRRSGKYDQVLDSSLTDSTPATRCPRLYLVMDGIPHILNLSVLDLKHVCVCVCFYYTPFSSVARGVRYLLQRLWFI